MKHYLVLLSMALAHFPSAYGVENCAKKVNAKIWAHIMPWFETRDSSGTDTWGIHWTMANQNPKVVDDSGKRQIASYYYPEIGPYGSGKYATVEYQLNLMKASGIDGVLIDWPGTVSAWDFPKNLANSEEIISGCERFGLEFAIVYEDSNIGRAFDAGLISDQIDAAQADMKYLRDVYMPKGNYIRVDGAPLLLVFGPQIFKDPKEWDAIFTPFKQNPTFLTLWYQSNETNNAAGEYSWIFDDFLKGLKWFYDHHTLKVKMGGAYPGFKSFYAQGGWSGPDWKVKTGPDTFSQTLELAIKANVTYIQLVTWNDYGEGTMIEPTTKYGNQFLNILQKTLGVSTDDDDLETVKKLYKLRLAFKNNKTMIADLDDAAKLLANCKVKSADKILSKLLAT